MDDASHKTRVGVGLQLKAPLRERKEKSIQLGFLASNNEIEYEEILVGVNLTESLSL